MDKMRLAGRRQSVTLAEVARLAHVSEITVSRILRNQGPVAEKTRERVIAAARRVGYVPNRLAGGLASAGSKLIGVIVPSLTNIVFPEVLHGIHSALEGTGFQAVLGVSDYDTKMEEQLVASLLAWKPEAMVIAGFDHTDAARAMLESSGVRIAEVMEIDSRPIDVAVGLSHRRAGFDTGRYLIDKGYTRFAYVGHDWNSDRRARLPDSFDRKILTMLLGAVADDLTGATDLSLMLARNGMRTVQYIGVPTSDADFDDAEAVVVALKSRTIPATEAIALSTSSAHVLIAAGAEQLMFKYCSTFDSTDAGNIGPVAEALLDLVSASIAIVCPAFPAAARTVYSGHLFVGGELLSDSPMSDHPLTPMRDAHLLRVLRRRADR